VTPAEEVLWNMIRINEWRLKFRRQHPLSRYIADFYCHKIKLVVEVDGGYHEDREVKIYDDARENEIKQFGITVLRFKNEEIINAPETVLNKIAETISMLRNSAGKKEVSLNNSPSGDGGKLFVIKIGGNVIDDDKALHSFLHDFASINAKKILVHGGGKIATGIGEKLGISSSYVAGRRITDAATIDLVTMVYGGLVNKKIVAILQSFQCNAIGLTGADANIIPAVKRPVKDIDYGFVGDINKGRLDTPRLELFLENGLSPVLAPLTHDSKGQMLNTNADTIAAAVAEVLSEDYDVRLVYCFEKKGVLVNVDDENSVIPFINREKYAELLEGKKLFDGILPKIDNAFSAISNGVHEVLIGHAKDLLNNVSENTSGTLISI
jgi:acetylglutamate kinase